MSKKLVFIGVISLVLIAVFGYRWRNARRSAAYAAASLPEKGRMLIDDMGCKSCHQPGSNYRAPFLRGLIGQTVKLADGSEVTADAAYVRTSLLTPKAQITAGYQGVMPSYEGRLTEAEITAIIAALSEP